MIDLLYSLYNTAAAFAVIGAFGALIAHQEYGKPWWSQGLARLDGVFYRIRDRHQYLPLPAAIGAIVLLLLLSKTLATFALALFATPILLWRSLIPTYHSIRGSRDDQKREQRWKEELDDGQFVLPMEVHSSQVLSKTDRRVGVLPLPRRSLLVLGASGAGKTEAAKHIVYQMMHRLDSASPVIVFDRKDDYQEMFDELDIPYRRISVDDSTICWNCFQEFENERDMDEFARSLYPEGADFFDDSAPMVFAAILKALVRENGGSEGLSNHSIVRYFETSDLEQIHDDLASYPDLTGEAATIDVETAPKQAQGVYANLRKTVTRVFIGDFGSSPDHDNGMAVRQYMADPQGEILLFDFPNRSETTKPIFRFLIDQAASFALDDDVDDSFFILDEFAQIPHLRQIETLLNVGRGKGAHVLATIQSVSQIEENYGAELGQSMLAGFVSKILLSPNDEDSVEFVQNSVGQDWYYDDEQETRGTMERMMNLGSSGSSRKVEQHVFSSGQIGRWDAGEGVIIRDDGWTKGYIPMLNEYISGLVSQNLGQEHQALENNEQKELEPQPSDD